MNILVTGGAGFIGSHVMKALARRGYNPVALDDLSAGRQEAVRYGELIIENIHNFEKLTRILKEKSIDSVIHMSGSIEVGESVANPLKYYDNNPLASVRLLEAMREAGVCNLVFSSTAAVYGEPQTEMLDETHPLQPVNPYGWSKRMTEQVLADTAAVSDLRYVALRYFNAAGADPDGELGENHDPETHLIPRACMAAQGAIPELTLFGNDWPTPDGTPIRDYIHVTDLAEAHVLAVEYLANGGTSEAMNLGTGRGSSVGEALRAVEKAAGKPVPTTFGPRRAGDPVRLVANPEKARRLLGWEPKHSNLDEIAATAWRWFSRP